jgi:hypothetical protein
VRSNSNFDCRERDVRFSSHSDQNADINSRRQCATFRLMPCYISANRKTASRGVLSDIGCDMFLSQAAIAADAFRLLRQPNRPNPGEHCKSCCIAIGWVRSHILSVIRDVEQSFSLSNLQQTGLDQGLASV